jgi:hypothetical protein
MKQVCPRCGASCGHLKNFDVVEPPAQPKDTIYMTIEVVASFSVFAIASAMWISNSGNEWLRSSLMVYLVLLPFVAAWGIDQRIKIKRHLPRWERSVKRYDRLYYCEDDELVFDRHARVLVPVEMAENHIYHGI